MRKAWLFLSALPLAGPAAAQTMLTLNATGNAEARPDEAVATLTVQASAAQAGDAQAAVNQAMAKALAAARALPGVQASTGTYSSFATTPDGQSVPQVTASQTLQLIEPAPGGVPSTAFAAMLGRLQAAGLLLNGLAGDLSPPARDSTRRQAVRDALAQLTAEAADIAATLHKRVGEMKTLDVQTGDVQPGPGPRLFAMAAAAPPQSAPAPVNMSAGVTAQIELDAAN